MGYKGYTIEVLIILTISSANDTFRNESQLNYAKIKIVYKVKGLQS